MDSETNADINNSAKSEITVSSGYCAPVIPIYDLFPIITAERGGITFDKVGTNWKPSTNKNDRFLTMAMGVALSSKCRMKHGAVVVKHGRILGSSPNLWKNDPKNVHYKHASVHAEMAALRKAGWPTKVTVYVARVNGKGESRLSKPCANCQVVLDEMKIKVVYTS